MKSYAEFKHEVGPNYNFVELIIAKDGGFVKWSLKLDKQLDVSDGVLKKLDEYHNAMQLMTEAINDELIEIENAR